jgi:DNA-binding NarL/FixJ family response regulator
MPRILLADDHPVVRRHLRDMLQGEMGWEVCAEARTGREAVTMAAAEHPDVAVLDLSMPELNGLQAARLIHEQLPETEIIILTAHEPVELMDRSEVSGVRECVLKTDLHHLVTAIRHVWQQHRNLPALASDIPEAIHTALGDKADMSADLLTDIERRIVQMFAQARSNRDVAEALSLTVNKVDLHLAAIMDKLEIDSVVDLVHFALRHSSSIVTAKRDEPLQ